MPTEQKQALRDYQLIEKHKCTACGQFYGLTDLEVKGVQLWVSCDCCEKQVAYLINTDDMRIKDEAGI